MGNNNLAKVGGLCAILLGISYIVVGIAFLLAPEAQQQGIQAGGDAAQFLTSFDEEPTLLSLQFLAFALGAVFAFGAIPAIAQLVQAGNEGWMRWMSVLAYAGFAVVAVQFFRLLALLPDQANAFVAAEEDLQPILAQDFYSLALDPQGWLAFGAVGLWVLVVSLLALRENAFPQLLALVGIVAAIAYGLVVAGNVLDSEVLVTIAAGAGAVILGPIWYIWLGVRLWQLDAQPVAVPAAAET